MDNDRAIEVLEWWVTNAEKARARGYSNGVSRVYDYGSTKSKDVIALREREDQTRRVLRSTLGLEKLPVLLRPLSSDGVSITEGVDLCRYGIGRLKTDAETRAIVGTKAPTMAADALHATIWNAASDLWADGHHGQAVARAANFLNAHVQSLIGRTDLADGGLMRQAFSMESPSPESPRLRWPGKDDDLTVRAMRTGILNFSQGIYAAIRNPATHSVDDLPRQQALEQLAALSVLARWMDGCDVVRVTPTKNEK